MAATSHGPQRHLILGVTGAIGFWCARRLLDRGEHVVALTRDPKRTLTRFAESEPNLTIVQGDALQESDVVGAAKGVASIFHCVNLPYPAWHDPHDGIVPMLRHTVTAAEQHSARIVFPGNVYVFGHVKAELVTEDQPFAPHTRKGRLRAQMEDMLATAWHRDGVPFVTVRMPDFYGPAVDNALYRPLFENALTGRPLAWYGDLDAPLELMLIGDAATAMVEAGLDPGSAGETYHVGGPQETTARRWLSILAHEGGVGARVTAVPPALIAAYGLVNREAREFLEMRYLKTERLILSGEKYRRRFGRVPATPYEEGIRRTLALYRAGRLSMGPS